MGDTEGRIEQFRKMAAEDPGNELGHFSLGRAYLDAGRYDDAIASFGRAIELNRGTPRAYQFIASAYVKKGEKDRGIEFLSTGMRIAQERGDRTAGEEMRRSLEELGIASPRLAEPEAARASGEGEVFCHRCVRIGRKLGGEPMRNALGREIGEKICQLCWREWIAMGTKVINELHLTMADPESQRVFEQHMREFLDLESGVGDSGKG